MVAHLRDGEDYLLQTPILADNLGRGGEEGGEGRGGGREGGEGRREGRGGEGREGREGEGRGGEGDTYYYCFCSTFQ